MTSTFTNQSKNTATFTNQFPEGGIWYLLTDALDLILVGSASDETLILAEASSFTNQTKNTAIFTNQIKN